MKSRVQSLEAVCFVHQTEDLGKVSSAMGSALSFEGAAETETLEGHFGNQIVRLRYHLTGDDAEKAFVSVAAGLPRALKDELRKDPTPYLDEHSSMYLRFDKQSLVEGRLSVAGSDPVRLKVKPRGFVKGRAREFYSELLGEN